MAQALTTSVTGDAGLLGVGLVVTHVLKWQFRPQDLADLGIDAQIEPVLGGRPSGRLLGVQIKAGLSWFGKSTRAGDGWVFREKAQAHRDYWLSYKLPVIVVLYDPERHVAYWQHDSAVVTDKGFKIVIPSRQGLDASAHDVLAKLAREVPPDGLSAFLDQLPESCATRLRFWDEINPTGARRLAADLVACRDCPEETVHEVTGEWPADQSWLAWMAVGEYAREYGLARGRRECFLAADRWAMQPRPPGAETEGPRFDPALVITYSQCNQRHAPLRGGVGGSVHSGYLWTAATKKEPHPHRPVRRME